MHIKDFDYKLPENCIAQHPPKVRGDSKLLVLNRQNGLVQHCNYADVVNYLESGDVVVLNNTKVIKARLIATNKENKQRELLLLEQHGHTFGIHTHKVLYRGKIHSGEQLGVHGHIVTVKTVKDNGIAVIQSSTNLLKLSEQFGSVPLPPYMKREASLKDAQRYQTIFAKKAGSVAAPTASLNFTKNLEQKLHAKGVKIVYLTLHVGLGTFLPIRVNDITKHKMHSEYFEIPAETVAIIQQAKRSGKKILAVGTTVTRTLEYCSNEILNTKPRKLSGEADIFIYPGYTFKVLDKLLTNFHAPRTTVLMLAAAFAGWDNLKNGYQAALENGYQFLSYGDSMLIQ